MAEIASGTEQNDWDLDSSEQLEVDGANTSFTLTATGSTQIMVQLGNAGNLLHTSGGILAITIKVTNIDTGDKCVMGQKQMNLKAGDQLALIACDPFWAEVGSTIEVHAKSSNGNDTSVGGKVWLVDVTPSATVAAAAVVAALMADTGFTAGGTMTYEELLQLLAGMVAGTWRDKPTDSTKQELLDADDDSTILLEIDLATTTPYKQVTIKI